MDIYGGYVPCTFICCSANSVSYTDKAFVGCIGFYHEGILLTTTLPRIEVMVGSAAQLHDQVGRLAEEYYAATWRRGRQGGK